MFLILFACEWVLVCFSLVERKKQTSVQCMGRMVLSEQIAILMYIFILYGNGMG